MKDFIQTFCELLEVAELFHLKMQKDGKGETDVAQETAELIEKATVVKTEQLMADNMIQILLDAGYSYEEMPGIFQMAKDKYLLIKQK